MAEEEIKVPTKVKNEVIIDPSLEQIIEAVLNVSQRRKRAMTMRKYKGKMKMARARMKKRKASPDKLKQRARRAAIAAMKKKMSGNKDYSSMSAGEKAIVDKRVAARKSAVDRLAKRMLVKVRQKDMEKFRPKPALKTEHATISNLDMFVETVMSPKSEVKKEQPMDKNSRFNKRFGN